MTEVVRIYTDGACKGNPGPGGWGALLQTRRAEKELYGGERFTTNNRMELMAVIRALEALKRPSQVEALHRFRVRKERDHSLARRVEATRLEDSRR